jgi:HD-GYP domain-containing protein (c-di-GMP phosphodiesterase class II)
VIQTIDSIIMLLSKGITNRKLYHSEHPKVESYAVEALALLKKYFQESGSNELFIGTVDGFFVFEGRRIFGSSVTGKQFLDFAASLHCGGFALQKGVTLADLRKFFDISAIREIEISKVTESQALFKNQGIEKIRVAEPYTDTAAGGQQSRRKRAWDGYRSEQGTLSPTLFFQELFDTVASAHGNAALNREVDVGQTRSVSEFMLRYIQKDFADVMQFIHYPDYDSYTVGHSVRVASLAVYVGSRMGWPEKEMLGIGTAGLLHDIGKCKIPDEILLKKGRLNDAEFAVIRDHPRAGVEVLLELPGTTEIDLAACWGHHIRHDGGGYPRQPSWAVHHPVTALLHICDVFEALTAARPYKPAMEPQAAYSIMLGDRGGFHPGLLAAFIRMVGLYPPGTYVRLSDRRVGLVKSAGREIDRPGLTIVTSAYGEPLAEEDRYLVDLGDEAQNDLAVDQLILEYQGEGLEG